MDRLSQRTIDGSPLVEDHSVRPSEAIGTEEHYTEKSWLQGGRRKSSRSARGGPLLYCSWLARTCQDIDSPARVLGVVTTEVSQCLSARICAQQFGLPAHIDFALLVIGHPVLFFMQGNMPRPSEYDRKTPKNSGFVLFPSPNKIDQFRSILFWQ